jgi:hypothetical protein
MATTYDITVKNGKTYKGVLFTVTINSIACAIGRHYKKQEGYHNVQNIRKN